MGNWAYKQMDRLMVSGHCRLWKQPPVLQIFDNYTSEGVMNMLLIFPDSIYPFKEPQVVVTKLLKHNTCFLNLFFSCPVIFLSKGDRYRRLGQH